MYRLVRIKTNYLGYRPNMSNWIKKIDEATELGSLTFNQGNHVEEEGLYYRLLLDLKSAGALYGVDFIGKSNKSTPTQRAWEYRLLLNKISRRIMEEIDKGSTAATDSDNASTIATDTDIAEKAKNLQQTIDQTKKQSAELISLWKKSCKAWVVFQNSSTWRYPVGYYMSFDEAEQKKPKDNWKFGVPRMTYTIEEADPAKLSDNQILDLLGVYL